MLARFTGIACCCCLLVCTAACSKPAQPKGHHAAASASSITETPSYGRLSVDEVAAKIKQAQSGKLALYIFDTNDKARFAKSHLPGANWLDHDNLQAASFPAAKDATLVFYCGNEA